VPEGSHLRRGVSVDRSLGSEAQVGSKATFTLWRLIGAARWRTPVASKTAFEIDAGTMALEGSPAPNGGSVGRSTSSITISGTSGKVRMGGGRPRRCEDDEGKRKFLCCWLNNLFNASPNRIPRTPAYGVI
jgi:hypothetical protein